MTGNSEITKLCKKSRIAIITNIIPHYREDFYNRIAEFPDYEFTLFCQKEIAGSGIQVAHNSIHINKFYLRYVGLKQEKFGIQLIPLIYLLRNFDAYIVHGNPRILSNIAASFLFKFFRKPIAIWGQARTASSKAFLENLKLRWWKFFRFLFLYNDSEVKFLEARGFKNHFLVGMNNGLDQERVEKASSLWKKQELEEWRKKKELSNSRVILSCARLTAKNQFDLMIYALPELVKKFETLKWCVIGDGPEIHKIQALTEELGVENNVIFAGEILDENILAPWFLSSELFVHPSGIGLSLLHAFSYGLPVVSHGDPRHQMPEFIALKDNINGCLFERNSVDSLSASISKVLKDRDLRQHMSWAALNTAKYQYNTEIMSQNFKRLCTALTQSP